MPIQSEVLLEARRLYVLGFAVHWLRPKSKIPFDDGWSLDGICQPRDSWKSLEASYREGFNVGIRLGSPSKIDGGFLAVIDLDVKSKDPRHRAEAMTAAQNHLSGKSFPVVRSGRGNGSRHFYCVTEKPFKSFKSASSSEFVKVFMPSTKPSKKEFKVLSPKEVASGIRIRRAWEIGLMSEGVQVVVPPSVHPDSGEKYLWKRAIGNGTALPVLPASTVLPIAGEGSLTRKTVLDDFAVRPVDLLWLPHISKEIVQGITEGVGVEDRSAYLLKATAALFSAGLTRDEVLSVLTDPKYFLASCGYEHTDSGSRRAAANWLYRYTVKGIEDERNPANIFKTVEILVPRKLSVEEQSAQAREFQQDRYWRQDLIRNKLGNPANLIQNVFLVMSNAVSPDVVRRDEFAYRDSYSCDTPWGGKTGNIVSDDDVDECQLWLGRNYGFEPSKNIVESALVVIARQNAYDPVKNFLDGLPQWDGEARLDTWLTKNFDAEGDLEYLAQVFRKWMVAMVMRVYQPGAKFDWMPIFEGTQGIGKSSFGRLLVGDKYFLDWLPNLNDKDAALSLQGMWGVEMGELSQFRGNALENIKAFITRTVDKIRPPYGKRLIESARRCVFFGTTNRGRYLIDETGNRRFKPVEVGRLNFEILIRDRLQMFSEAKHLWTEKIETERTMELTGLAKVYEHEIHTRKMIEDDSHAMTQAMEDFIEKVRAKQVIFDLEKFRILDLFGEGVGAPRPLARWKPEMRNLKFAAKMLKNMNAKDRVIKGLTHWELPETGKNVDFW